CAGSSSDDLRLSVQKPRFSEYYAELARLSASYSPSEGRLPTCYAPVRRAPPVLLQARTRLACVKHAASVRSEPGSNSRLKPVAWAKKMLRFASEPAYPSKLLSLEFTQTIRARKLGWLRTDSGTSYRLSKSKAPLSSRKAQLQPKEYHRGQEDCQYAMVDFHRHLRQHCKCFGHGRMRTNSWQSRCIAVHVCPPRRNSMKKILVALVVALLFADISLAQNPDVKFIADTLIVQADGIY